MIVGFFCTKIRLNWRFALGETRLFACYFLSYSPIPRHSHQFPLSLLAPIRLIRRIRPMPDLLKRFESELSPKRAQEPPGGSGRSGFRHYDTPAGRPDQRHPTFGGLKTMLTRDLFRLSAHNPLLHKIRSLLTSLGIIFGVCSVISMLAISEGAKKNGRSNMDVPACHTSSSGVL